MEYTPEGRYRTVKGGRKFITMGGSPPGPIRPGVPRR